MEEKSNSLLSNNIEEIQENQDLSGDRTGKECCCQKKAKKDAIGSSDCCHKKKERDAKEYRDLMNRLKRIEGQVRGLQGMVERDCYCTDILVQVAAVNAALNSFNKVLLANHLRTCVTENIRNGNDEIIDELVTLLQKLMK